MEVKDRTSSPEEGHRNPSEMKMWQSFVAGAGAGLINVSITYPLQKLMFRQMVHGVMPRMAFAQLKKEGVRILYRGVLPPLLQKGISMSIMFGGYESYGRFFISNFDINPQLAKSAGAGLSGISEAILTPFERVQVLLQDQKYNSKLTNTRHAVTHIWKNYGITEFYRGASLIVVRNSVSSIFFFFAKEKAQSALPKPKHMWNKLATDFICGGFIGAALSTFYYPLTVIKTRMQCRLGGQFESPKRVFETVLVERGRNIRELFRGVHLNYTRQLLSWGIINAAHGLLIMLLDKTNKTS
ncbi:solute carrier family 25 member 51 [Folsomia candida]|uniref:solute carrier family 25 member 51 n=1 Tax=Folsomia candida TaxID=158441 RepID=UPI000B8FD752|nr:solute carrier family 25 member 51 [Folsomia candida]